MTSSKFFTLSFFIVATLATTSTDAAHRALVPMPMGLEELPDPFKKTAQRDTAQELQLAIARVETFHGYQVQLTHAQRLLDEAQAKNQTVLTDDEQIANNKRIDDMRLAIHQLNPKIEQCQQAQERNKYIIDTSIDKCDDPTTVAVVQAMRALSDLEKKHNEECKQGRPRIGILNSLENSIQTNRRIIFDGLNKGIYPYVTNEESNLEAVLSIAIETVNPLVVEYMLEKYPNVVNQHTFLSHALCHSNDNITQMILTHRIRRKAESSILKKELSSVIIYPKILEKLLSNHYNPDISLDGNNNTLLHLAAKDARVTAIEPLLNHHADVHRKNNLGQTALQVTFPTRDSTSTKKILNELLAAGATKEINDADRFGKTTLDSLIDDTVINNNNEDHLIDCALILLDAGAIIREAPHRTYSRTEQAFINAVLEKRRKTTTPPKNKTTMLSIFMRIVSLFK